MINIKVQTNGLLDLGRHGICHALRGGVERPAGGVGELPTHAGDVGLDDFEVTDLDLDHFFAPAVCAVATSGPITVSARVTPSPCDLAPTARPFSSA